MDASCCGVVAVAIARVCGILCTENSQKLPLCSKLSAPARWPENLLKEQTSTGKQTFANSVSGFINKVSYNKPNVMPWQKFKKDVPVGKVRCNWRIIWEMNINLGNRKLKCVPFVTATMITKIQNKICMAVDSILLQP